MSKTKISSKYQIVVPKNIREKMHLRVGETIIVRGLDENRAIISRGGEANVESLVGLGKDVWSKLGGGDKYIKQERASWERG